MMSSEEEDFPVSKTTEQFVNVDAARGVKTLTRIIMAINSLAEIAGKVSGGVERKLLLANIRTLCELYTEREDGRFASVEKDIDFRIAQMHEMKKRNIAMIANNLSSEAEIESIRGQSREDHVEILKDDTGPSISKNQDKLVVEKEQDENFPANVTVEGHKLDGSSFLVLPAEVSTSEMSFGAFLDQTVEEQEAYEIDNVNATWDVPVATDNEKEKPMKPLQPQAQPQQPKDQELGRSGSMTKTNERQESVQTEDDGMVGPPTKKKKKSKEALDSGTKQFLCQICSEFKTLLEGSMCYGCRRFIERLTVEFKKSTVESGWDFPVHQKEQHKPGTAASCSACRLVRNDHLVKSQMPKEEKLLNIPSITGCSNIMAGWVIEKWAAMKARSDKQLRGSKRIYELRKGVVGGEGDICRTCKK